VTRHVDAETLARYRQEDLSRRRGSRVRAHLARCERCRALDEDLAGVTALLADAQPPPMPEHLAARIQTALAAEAARRVALPGQVTSAAPGAGAGGEAPQSRTEPAGTGVPDRRTSRHGRHGRDRMRRQPRFTSPVALRTMAAAAAVVVLAGGGYEIAQHVGGSSSQRSTASGSAATPPRQGNFSAPAAGGSTALPGPRYLHAAHTDIPVVASQTNYTPAMLKDQVRNMLARYGQPALSGPSALRSPVAAGNPSATFGNIPVSTLAGCVTRVADGRQVLLVDVARYRGTPATVIVTRTSAGGPEQVWVVSPGCSSRRITLLAHATLGPAG
jgi:hypothetical protein